MVGNLYADSQSRASELRMMHFNLGVNESQLPYLAEHCRPFYRPGHPYSNRLEEMKRSAAPAAALLLHAPWTY
jgi:hypothetical protein